MQLGFKNRLKLISLVPILVLFTLASYFAYESFTNYQMIKTLQSKFSDNRQINELLSDISKERGLSAMHLGSSSSITKSLQKQRKIVDNASKTYLFNARNNDSLHNHNNGTSACQTCSNINALSIFLQKMSETRLLIDRKEIDFKDIYVKTYGKVQDTLIKQLEAITHHQTDPQIIELSSTYIALVRAKKATASERDLISYALSRSTEIQMDELSLWLSLIAKSGLIHYDTIQNKELVEELNTLFKHKKNINLIDEINLERTDIISSASTGYYGSSPDNWFSLLSEKENIISQAQEILLTSMENRASTIQEEALQMFIVSLIIWVISILTALLSILLSNEISDNIKSLENVLNRVAEDTKDSHYHNIDIDLQSSAGTNEAYKLLERIIKQTREDKIIAQEASEAKSMFLANMSHEIRTPLNGIVGFTELLKDSGLKEEQGEFIDIIEKSSENLLEIINNILDLSKIESNKLEIEDTVFNPIEEFESAVEVYAVRASEKHIDLGCFIDPELEQLLKGDPTKLKEIIINLLSNAVKFTTSSGSINVNIRKINSKRLGITRIHFEVEDTGIGVTSEQKERIFEAFSQADTSITRKYGGTGLGLTISSKFVELMGGQLDLQSQPGKGTKFFFTIDFEEVDRLNELTKGNYLHITALLLEGNHKHKMQDTYIREYLDYYGVDYTIFKDKEELELLISQNEYNLLFIDYDYSGEHGLIEYAKQSQELIVITKATYIRKVDSLNLDIFKTLYEPLSNSKIKALLETIYSKNFQVKKDANKKRKKFNLETSKFKANILIAEDNIINQKLIKRTLEALGLTITIANNGLEAFQKRKDGNFDLVFMDIQMPYLDGIEATKEILDYEEDYNQKHIPIIAITANALKGDRERFLDAGLDEYTTKPLIRDEIISLLNHYLSDFIIDDEKSKKRDINTEEPSIEIDDAVVKRIEQTTKSEVVAVAVEDIIEKEEEVNIPIEDVLPEYKADILLAKKSSFEAKLFARLLKSLNYSFDIVNSKEQIQEHIKQSTYKVILFDKAYQENTLAEFSTQIKDSNDKTKLKTNLILISDPLNTDENDDNLYVQEIIESVVNKDSLKIVFEKFIQG